MAAMVRGASFLIAIRSEATTSGNGAPVPDFGKLTATSLLSGVSKPRWFVRTESNVRKEKLKNPDPPCVICGGSGRVDCYDCHGKGRTNYMKLPMLPKGEWPKWCRSCGGSGLGYCSRCVGTGEYRYIMGFQFMKNDDTDRDQGSQRYQVGNRKGSHSFTDLLLNNDQQSNSD